MKYIIFTIFLLSLSACNSTQVKREASSGTIGSVEPTMTDYQRLWVKYTVNPKNERGQNSSFYRVIAKEEKSAMVYFTKEDHPAYPSYFKIFLKVEDEDGEVKSAAWRLESFTLGNAEEYEKELENMRGFVGALSEKLQKDLSEK